MPSTQLLTDSAARCVDATHLLDADRMFRRAGSSDGVEIGDIDTAEASTTASSEIVICPAVGEITERFDPITCLDPRP
jgi:hypothetical protein